VRADPGGQCRSSRSSRSGSSSRNADTRPSSPGEFHPEPLTDPCVTVSSHTARATPGKLPPSVTTAGFLLLPVDHTSRDADGPSPLLHGHYPVSSLLRDSPPLPGESVLSASRVRRLCLFPLHRRTGSQVPDQSPGWSHATSTPDTAWPVIRYRAAKGAARILRSEMTDLAGVAALKRCRTCFGSRPSTSAGKIPGGGTPRATPCSPLRSPTSLGDAAPEAEIGRPTKR
jgi:hypothetical protein